MVMVSPYVEWRGRGKMREVCVCSCMQASSFQSATSFKVSWIQLFDPCSPLKLWLSSHRSLQFSRYKFGSAFGCHPRSKAAKIGRRDQWSSRAITTISLLARLKMNRRYRALRVVLLQASWKLWDSRRLGSWQQTGIGMTKEVRIYASTTCTHYNISLKNIF